MKYFLVEEILLLEAWWGESKLKVQSMDSYSVNEFIFVFEKMCTYLSGEENGTNHTDPIANLLVQLFTP